MHPNWKALATVYIKHQPFVTEKPKKLEIEQKQKYSIQTNNSTGKEVSKFYAEVINLPSTSISQKQLKPSSQAIKCGKIVKKCDFTYNQLCQAILQDKFELVEEICLTNKSLINEKDQYNWTPLMMAACEGSLKSFNILLKYNCDIDVCDRKGDTIYTLAKKKNHINILQSISNYLEQKYEYHKPKKIEVKLEIPKSSFYCNSCKYKFTESTVSVHNTSILHQFNLDHHKFPTRFGINEENRGYQLMLKQGWNKNSRLGSNQDGTLYPVKTTLRDFRTGLGVEQKNEPRVTHFKPFDRKAVKYIPKIKSYTKKDLYRDLNRDRYMERKIKNDLS